MRVGLKTSEERKGKIKTRRLAEIGEHFSVSAKRTVDFARKGKKEVTASPWRNSRDEKIQGTTYDEHDHVAKKHDAMERAEGFQAYLGHKFPNFVQPTLPSQVSGGFWMGLPKKFCRLHFPSVNTIVNLIDEAGDCYETVFLARRNGLSGGWRRFSLSHGLLLGDVLVFQLVERLKFKVFIVRAHSPCDVDAVLGLMALSDVKLVAKCGYKEGEIKKPLPLVVHQSTDKGSSMATCSDAGPSISQSEKHINNVIASADVSQETNVSRPPFGSKGVKIFGTFITY